MNALQVLDRYQKEVWYKLVHKRMIKRFSIFTITLTPLVGWLHIKTRKKIKLGCLGKKRLAGWRLYHIQKSPVRFQNNDMLFWRCRRRWTRRQSQNWNWKVARWRCPRWRHDAQVTQVWILSKSWILSSIKTWLVKVRFKDCVRWFNFLKLSPCARIVK